jgi:uncharacterized protein
MALTPDRRAEYDNVLASSLGWATADPRVRGLALVGSWARGEATMASDIDLVVLTDDVEAFIATADWIRSATGQDGLIVRSKAWGPVNERRVELASGLLVEYGFAPVTWASTDPLDTGTAQVVAHGFRLLYDPEEMLRGVATAVRQLQA